MNILNENGEKTDILFRVWGFPFIPKGSPMGTNEGGVIRIIPQPEDFPRLLLIRINDEVTYEFSDEDISIIEKELAYINRKVNMNFGEAITQLKAGNKVARQGWNGKNMWLKLQVPDEHSKMTLPYVYIEYPQGHPAYPDGSRVPWLASQTDMLSDDWNVVE